MLRATLTRDGGAARARGYGRSAEHGERVVASPTRGTSPRAATPRNAHRHRRPSTTDTRNSRSARVNARRMLRHQLIRRPIHGAVASERKRPLGPILYGQSGNTVGQWRRSRVAARLLMLDPHRARCPTGSWRSP